MRAQCLDRVVFPRQLAFGQGCMDFIVANLMKSHHRATFSSAQFRYQMVQALARFWRNWPRAQRANRISFTDHAA